VGRAGLEESLEREFGETACCSVALKDETGLDEEKLRVRIVSEADRRHAEKALSHWPDVMRILIRPVMFAGAGHAMEGSSRGHGLSAPGHSHWRLMPRRIQRKSTSAESFVLFSDMLTRIRHDVINLLAHVQVQAPQDVEALESQNRQPEEMHFVHPCSMRGGQPEEGDDAAGAAVAQKPDDAPPTQSRRNEPCPAVPGRSTSIATANWPDPWRLAYTVYPPWIGCRILSVQSPRHPQEKTGAIWC